MRFYEFDEEYDYYALIGALNEATAVDLYNEVICDSDESSKPQEIDLEQAKEKMLKSCKNNRQKREELTAFNKNIQGTEPCLVLVENGVL